MSEKVESGGGCVERGGRVGSYTKSGMKSEGSDEVLRAHRAWPTKRGGLASPCACAGEVS